MEPNNSEKKPLNFLSDDFMYASIMLFLQEAGVLDADDETKGNFIEKVTADFVERANANILNVLSQEQIPLALQIAESEMNFSEREAEYIKLIANFPEIIKTVMDLIRSKIAAGAYNQ